MVLWYWNHCLNKQTVVLLFLQPIEAQYYQIKVEHAGTNLPKSTIQRVPKLGNLHWQALSDIHEVLWVFQFPQPDMAFQKHAASAPGASKQ